MPSIINKLLMKDVSAVVEANDMLLFVNPIGLNAEDSLALRKSLSEAGASMRVVKTSLLKKQVSEDMAKILEDSTSVSVVSGEDLAAAAKLVQALVKEEKMTVCGALVEGKAMNAAEAAALANLPSRQQLHGMLVNVLAAPIVGLARVIKEVPTSLVRAIKAIQDSK